MNLGITVTGAILVAICAAPVIYFVSSQKNEKKQLVQALKNAAAQFGHIIDKFDICSHFVIGIDNTSSSLYLVKQKENKIEQYNLSLKDITAATLETHYGKNTSLKVVERLGIRFLPKKGHVSDMYWELYNSDDSFQLNGELQLAQSWIERINKAL